MGGAISRSLDGSAVAGSRLLALLWALLSTGPDEDGLTQLLSTHPAAEERLERLVAQSDRRRSRIDR